MREKEGREREEITNVRRQGGKSNELSEMFK